jgi:nucleoid DNA-binding protein
MANLKQKKIVRIENPLRNEIRKGLIRFGKVKVVGLGIFETKRIKRRPGRHPQTGKIVMMPSYLKLKFRPAKALKEAVCQR